MTLALPQSQPADGCEYSSWCCCLDFSCRSRVAAVKDSAFLWFGNLLCLVMHKWNKKQPAVKMNVTYCNGCNEKYQLKAVFRSTWCETMHSKSPLGLRNHVSKLPPQSARPTDLFFGSRTAGTGSPITGTKSWLGNQPRKKKKGKNMVEMSCFQPSCKGNGSLWTKTLCQG